MASKLYGQFLLKALNKEVDWDSDTIKVALVSNPGDQDTSQYFSDVVANEISGAGYTAGGATLTGKTASYEADGNVIVLNADDVTFENSTITARYAVIYDATPGTDASRPLIGYVDFGSNQASSNGNFTITWDATGIVRITVA